MFERERVMFCSFISFCCIVFVAFEVPTFPSIETSSSVRSRRKFPPIQFSSPPIVLGTEDYQQRHKQNLPKHIRGNFY